MTSTGRKAYIARMSEAPAKTQFELEVRRLEKRLDDLMLAMKHLKEENRALRSRQDSLTAERSQLLQKNEQVRTRVEAMIGRLKAMEHGT